MANKDGSGGGGVVAPAGPTLGARRSGPAEDAPPKTRYHNGQIVAQRGEKYIVEKARQKQQPNACFAVQCD